MEENFLSSITDNVIGFVEQNPVASAVGAGVIGAGVVGLGLAISGAKGKGRDKPTSRKKKSSRGRSRDRKFKSKQKWEQRYKRKRKFKVYKSRKSSRRGIKYTKNGQPYKILANGRARFIKK